ncbi:GNAT family N-acetyltransferase [Bacillus salacetis]|uniref:GNAT family N-acetyltransferase n=1 Tax=Bacillus salacetis TaxID=2315464 RepID=A0A3A1R0Z8_9BACI|nr:GNAT family N-acetyltransferase [Bacillus salacetis]RIW33283.1 GNAT family N-acetyltransferase [Bacillus salacetis]
MEWIKATDVELEEIYELAGDNRREAANIDAPDNRQKMIETYEHSLKHNAYFLCLKERDVLLGWIMIDKAFDYLTGDEVGWINDLYVKQEFRGKGYSILLIEEAFKRFKDNGYNDVRLNVYTHNEKAVKLYEQMGFRDVSKFMKVTL